MGRSSLERDAPQSENLHLKEINDARLAAEAGTRTVGPRGGTECSRHKFQTLGKECSDIKIFGRVSAARGRAFGLSQLIVKPIPHVHLSVFLPRCTARPPLWIPL